MPTRRSARRFIRDFDTLIKTNYLLARRFSCRAIGVCRRLSVPNSQTVYLGV